MPDSYQRCEEPAPRVVQPDQRLRAQPWIDDEPVIVCAPSHPLVHDEPVARIGVKALRQQRWLLREPGSGTRAAVEHALLSHLHRWTRPMQLCSTEAIKQAAAEGLRLTCLSRCAVEEWRRGQASRHC